MRNFVITMQDGFTMGTRIEGTILDVLSMMLDNGEDITLISQITIKEDE